MSETATELARRLTETRRLMRRFELTALALPGPEDIYYLTGLAHQGHFAFTLLVIPLRGAPLLVARAMEATSVATLAAGSVHVPYADDERPAHAAANAIRRAAGDGRVGVERFGMSFPLAIYDELHRLLDGTGIELVDGSGLVEGLRHVKSRVEVGHTRTAATASSRAMTAAIAAIRAGGTERDVARDVHAELIGSGSEHPGFVPLIRTRGRLLLEHGTWTDQVIGGSDAVFVELSASVHRYHAPMSRMVYVGTPPAGLDRSARIAADGLEAVRAALVPGARAGEVYAAWQQVVDARLGHRRYRRHHCGYLVGIGFPPSWVGGGQVTGLRALSDLEIKTGMVFHVLSWLLGQQVPDFVLSDTVLVTRTGGEVLTAAPQDPIVTEV